MTELKEKIEKLVARRANKPNSYLNGIKRIAAQGEAIVPELIELLKSAESTNHCVRYVLIAIGPPAVPYLIETLTLKSKEEILERVHWVGFLDAICLVLGAIGDTRAVPILLEQCNHVYSDIQRAAHVALGNIVDVRGIRPLMLELAAHYHDLNHYVGALKNALEKIIEKCKSVEKLAEFKLEILAVYEQNKDSKYMREIASDLLLKLNERKNKLLANQIDIHLDKRTVPSPKKDQGTYRMRTARLVA